MLFLICILINFVFGDETNPVLLSVTHEKYMSYNWLIYNCDKNITLVITKNNQTYLNISLKPNANSEVNRVVIPWCAIAYNSHVNYEYYIIHDNCSHVNHSIFYVSNLKTYYATSDVNTYNIVNEENKKYALIEIPHYKNSLESSCMKINMKSITWKTPIVIKIYNDVDTCNYNSISNNYYVTNFKFEYKQGYFDIYMSNITLGCTYPTQIGPFDVAPNKKYIIEYDLSTSNELVFDIQIVTDPTYDKYKIMTIILGSILLGIIAIVFLFTIYIVYKKCYRDHEYEIVEDKDINNVGDNLDEAL